MPDPQIDWDKETSTTPPPSKGIIDWDKEISGEPEVSTKPQVTLAASHKPAAGSPPPPDIQPKMTVQHQQTDFRIPPPSAPPQQAAELDFGNNDPERPVGEISAVKHKGLAGLPNITGWVRDVGSDLAHGGTTTAPGRLMQTLDPGWHGTEAGEPQMVSDMMPSALVTTGPTHLASGLGTVLDAKDTHQIAQGINEMGRGAMAATALMGVANPGTFLPSVVGFGVTQAATTKALVGAGMDPEEAQALTTVVLAAAPGVKEKILPKLGEMISSNAGTLGKTAGYGTAIAETIRTKNPMWLLTGAPRAIKLATTGFDTLGKGISKVGETPLFPHELVPDQGVPKDAISRADSGRFMNLNREPLRPLVEVTGKTPKMPPGGTGTPGPSDMGSGPSAGPQVPSNGPKNPVVPGPADVTKPSTEPAVEDSLGNKLSDYEPGNLVDSRYTTENPGESYSISLADLQKQLSKATDPEEISQIQEAIKYNQQALDQIGNKPQESSNPIDTDVLKPNKPQEQPGFVEQTAKQQDWEEDFEKEHGRPPTDQEVDQWIDQSRGVKPKTGDTEEPVPSQQDEFNGMFDNWEQELAKAHMGDAEDAHLDLREQAAEKYSDELDRIIKKILNREGYSVGDLDDFEEKLPDGIGESEYEDYVEEAKDRLLDNHKDEFPDKGEGVDNWNDDAISHAEEIYESLKESGKLDQLISDKDIQAPHDLAIELGIEDPEVAVELWQKMHPETTPDDYIGYLNKFADDTAKYDAENPSEDLINSTLSKIPGGPEDLVDTSMTHKGFDFNQPPPEEDSIEEEAAGDKLKKDLPNLDLSNKEKLDDAISKLDGLLRSVPKGGPFNPEDVQPALESISGEPEPTEPPDEKDLIPIEHLRAILDEYDRQNGKNLQKPNPYREEDKADLVDARMGLDKDSEKNDAIKLAKSWVGMKPGYKAVFEKNGGGQFGNFWITPDDLEKGPGFSDTQPWGGAHDRIPEEPGGGPGAMRLPKDQRDLVDTLNKRGEETRAKFKASGTEPEAMTPKDMEELGFTPLGTLKEKPLIDSGVLKKSRKNPKKEK